jgi:hypothetical protein
LFMHATTHHTHTQRLRELEWGRHDHLNAL